MVAYWVPGTAWERRLGSDLLAKVVDSPKMKARQVEGLSWPAPCGIQGAATPAIAHKRTQPYMKPYSRVSGLQK